VSAWVDRENPLHSNAGAWNELIEAVGPASLLVVIESRLSSALRRQATAEDILQEALMHAWRDRASFEWRGLKSFRAWLRKVTLNKWRQLQRRRPVLSLDANGPALAELPSPENENALWDAEYQQYLVGRVLALIQIEFQPATWQAFWQTAVEGKGAGDVGKTLKMTAGAVYVAKSRVLARLRDEVQKMEAEAEAW
jgi:RNA polymerase sigma-70 factor (ECF subfamily)